jgi:hypothetical protein
MHSSKLNRETRQVLDPIKRGIFRVEEIRAAVREVAAAESAHARRRTGSAAKPVVSVLSAATPKAAKAIRRTNLLRREPTIQD